MIPPYLPCLACEDDLEVRSPNCSIGQGVYIRGYNSKGTRTWLKVGYMHVTCAKDALHDLKEAKKT